MVCSKAVFAGDCLGVPLRVGLSAASPRYAVGFSLQSLTWVKGISPSCACTLAHGLSRPGVRFRPLRQAAWPKPDIGRKDKRNTSVRAVTRGFGCSPKLPVPRPVRKSSPALRHGRLDRRRQPTGFQGLVPVIPAIQINKCGNVALITKLFPDMFCSLRDKFYICNQ